MKRKLIAFLGVAAIGLGTLSLLTQGQAPADGSSHPAKGDPIVAVTLPATLSARAEAGRRVFDATCATCHGEAASGRRGYGPPLVHPIYESSHHADTAFLRAAQQGAPAHHWDFGDMPPQPAVTPADVADMLAYVRELQRANGIN
ncbi:c-type cytochrome [Albidovulum sp.]|jgi:mono/diheme cytochrome c family protein|uniref:c-type cytochrome n=1 Tax=Albidovulum sp. TaxID=1872424 RepID=UPI0030656B79